MAAAKSVLEEARDIHLDRYLEDAEEIASWRSALGIIGECHWKANGELTKSAEDLVKKSTAPVADRSLNGANPGSPTTDSAELKRLWDELQTESPRAAKRFKVEYFE